MASARFTVSGLVQGVFFRASAQNRARELGITGHARNLADGRVEVIASGTPPALADFEAWLHEGPSSARVDAVAREDIAEQKHAGFTTH